MHWPYVTARVSWGQTVAAADIDARGWLLGAKLSLPTAETELQGKREQGTKEIADAYGENAPKTPSGHTGPLDPTQQIKTLTHPPSIAAWGHAPRLQGNFYLRAVVTRAGRGVTPSSLMVYSSTFSVVLREVMERVPSSIRTGSVTVSIISLFEEARLIVLLSASSIFSLRARA